MESEAGFTAIEFVELYLQVLTICDESLEYGCIVERIDAFVRPRYRVWVLSVDIVWIPVADTESKSAVFHRDKTYEWRPFHLSGFDNVLV